MALKLQKSLLFLCGEEVSGDLQSAAGIGRNRLNIDAQRMICKAADNKSAGVGDIVMKSREIRLAVFGPSLPGERFRSRRGSQVHLQGKSG